MTDRCINPNNSRIVELSEKLGKTKHEVAIDVKMWQDVNGNKIPTVDDLLGKPKEILYQKVENLTIQQKQAKKLFFDKIFGQNLSNADIQYVDSLLKKLSDSIGDVPWNLRLSKNGNYYVAGYKNFSVTSEDYYSPYGNARYKQNVSEEGKLASEKTIRDLAARMSDRIGMPFVIESDRTKQYKGKIENGKAYINLAYATLDTPIHEILGHPIIRAIKNRNSITEEYIKNAKFGYKLEGLSENEINKKIEELKLQSKNQDQLYQNLLKELETGRGKEVLDRIKKDYKYKYEIEESVTDYEQEFGKFKLKTSESGAVYFDTLEEGKQYLNRKENLYTLEEQQEEAIVELLGLMTAEKLDKVKDGKLISLLKRLLKEIKSYVKTLLNQKEVEIDKLPDNITIEDLADVLAYSNSKLLLPGYGVLYTTPDNMNFKTYQEASNHISQLAKSVKDVDLDNIKIKTQGKVSKIEDVPYYFRVTDGFNERNVVKRNNNTWYVSGNTYDNFTEERIKEIKKDTEVNSAPENYVIELYNKSVTESLIGNFIEKNKEYEQSKDIIEEWKKTNNIKYNPEEIYSRGQEFVSVVGAYSDFDVNLMMQNLLQHIEDNQKAGGEFTISAFTKPVDKTIGHLEGGGGKIKFKLYPQSKDILWAANTDVYSGSVWDASEKVSKDKKSELLGVSYTKYPSLQNVTAVQPNLASIVDNLAHHHNELGISLTGNNFRLEYDDNIPYKTKKIIDSVNAILDQKYGKVVKPEININNNVKYEIEGYSKQKFDSKEKAESVLKDLKNTEYGYKYGNIFISPTGIQPTQTKDNLKESIKGVKYKIAGDGKDVKYYTPKIIDEAANNAIGGIVGGYYVEVLDYDGGPDVFTFNTLEEANKFIEGKKGLNKEYTEQALINTKIAKLKEVAKKYPRSLIRSEVIQNKIIIDDPIRYDLFGEDEMPFQKIQGSQEAIVNNLLSLQGKQIQEDTFYTIPGFETKLKRPSTLAKKTIQERQEFKSEAEKRKDEIYTGTGTLIHAMQADIIKKNFPEQNTHIDNFEITPENAGIYKAVENDKQLQKVIADAKKEGTVLMAEVFVGNLKLERGGTVDLLGITPDGNYKIYDLKTRMSLDKGARRRFNKLEEFTKQLTEYRRILEEGDVRLGIPSGKILTTQILENKLDINLKTGKINKINGIEFVAPFFLRTEDAKLNSFINKLKEQIDLLLGKEPKEENLREQWEKLLNSKLELMQSLQLKQDVNELISHASIELSAIKEYLADETDADTTDLQSQLLLFASLDDYLDYDSLTDAQQNVLKNIMFESKRLHKKLIDRGKDVIVEGASNVGLAKFVDKLFSPIKDITFLRKMTMGISSVDNPLVNTGYRIVVNALEKSRSKLDELKDSLVPLIEEFKERVGGLDFDMMLTDDKESLVDKHAKEFWVEYYKNKKSFNPKWAKENLNYDKEAYNEAYKNKLNFEDSIKATEIKKIEAWLMLQETKPSTKEEVDKYVENIYWKNRKERFDLWFEKYENNSYFFFKPKDKWIDPKWKAIKEGEYKGTAVEKFYDFYTNYMQIANEVAPEKIKPTFIPNFTQTFLERTGELGLFGAIQGKWSELLNELSLEYDETLYGKVDPYTGEQLRQLYIPGLSKAKQNKSVDLATSLYTFMEGVYRYQELSAIEGTINHVKYQIRNLDELKVDSLGNPIDDATKIDSRKNPGKQIAEQFDYFVDAIIYNKQRKAEGGFELKGNGLTQAVGLLNKGDSKLISTAKIADGVIRYTGIRNLSFNLFAPMVNLLGASANQYMTGNGGIYYSNGDLTKAQGLLTAGGSTADGLKLKMIIEWLGIDRDKINRDVFKKLTKVTSSAILDKYNGMTMFRESEVLLVESGAGAMILSGKNGLTMDDFDVVNGKLTFKKEILPIDKALFKQKVIKVNGSNIGSMNTDDVLLSKKWMVGRMLMQHRSWLPQLAYKRFGTKQYDYILEREIEGRYRVAARAVKYIMMKGYSQGLESLTPDEIATAKEGFAELMLIAGTGLLLFALQGVDDEEKKEAWYKYTNTISTRLFGELFFFADPTLSSQFQILLSPAATTSTATELGKLVRDSWKEVAADMYEDPEQVRKKAKPIKRLVKMTPGAGQVQRFIDELYNPEDNK